MVFMKLFVYKLLLCHHQFTHTFLLTEELIVGLRVGLVLIKTLVRFRQKIDTNKYQNFILGAAHGDDTAYVFKTTVDTASTDDDRKMIELLVEIFTSFAKTG